MTIIHQMELRSMNPLNGLFPAQSEAGSLRGLFMPKEVWKKIRGYDGKYFVSNLGRVKSIKYLKPRIMKSRINNSGYLIMSLTKNGKRKMFTVHRLVISTFLRESNKSINHINGKKLDNRLCNLEYLSHRENCAHYWLKKKGAVGVYWRKKFNRWDSQIKINGKMVSLGRHKTKEDAQQAYVNAIKKYGLKNKFVRNMK